MKELESIIVRDHAFAYPTITVSADRAVLDSCYPMCLWPGMIA